MAVAEPVARVQLSVRLDPLRGQLGRRRLDVVDEEAEERVRRRLDVVGRHERERAAVGEEQPPDVTGDLELDAERVGEEAGDAVVVGAADAGKDQSLDAHGHRMPGCALALMIEGQEGVSWEDWLALARACEEHGVEALFRSDHYLSQTGAEQPALDAWAVIAALAAQTTRLELGTLVSPVTFRAAAVLANVSATANEIAAGRVSLGMGTGWMEAEHEAFGFPFPEMKTRLQWLEEQIQAVRRFWGDRPHPHLIVGGSGLSGTIRPAAKWADEYNTIFATPEECAERRRKLVRRV